MTQGVFTLLYNEEYLAGALVVAIALRKILECQPKINVTLGVIVDKERLNASQISLLQNLYDDIVGVEQLESSMDDRLTHDLGRPELKQTFTKIQLWSLTKYDKILYLDADTLPNVPKNESQGSILDLLKLEFPPNMILASPDSGFPDIFNSGVMLLKPNMSDYTNLLGLIEESKVNPKITFDGADQGLLNQYFNQQPDWVQDLVSSNQTDVAAVNEAKSSSWIPLPFLYNVTPSSEYEYLPAYKHFAHTGWLSSTYGSLGRGYASLLPHFNGENSQIKLVHFIGPVKPWKAELPIGIYGQWWDTWHVYFGNITVEEVIYHGGVDVLAEPSSYEAEEAQIKSAEEAQIESAEEAQIESAEESQSKPQRNDAFDPSYLCDPVNYQHIVTNIAPSADALWDPANEPPPVVKPVKHGTVELEKEMKIFTNVWDSSSYEEDSVQYEDSHVSAPEVVHSTTQEQVPQSGHPSDSPIKEEPLDEYLFGYHPLHEPERVFADDNIVLTHTYMPKETSEEADPASSSATSVAGQLKHEEIYNKLSELQIDELHAGSSEKDFPPELEDSQKDSPYSEIQVAKLFPWEFNDEQYVPERTFD